MGRSLAAALSLVLRAADVASLAARCYPAARLRRAVNEFDAAICAYRNREADMGRLIVLYCWDERASHAAAEIMFQKGVDNLLLLAGGLREFGAAYGDLVEGRPELPFRAPPAPRLSLSVLKRLAAAPSPAGLRPGSAPSASSGGWR